MTRCEKIPPPSLAAASVVLRPAEERRGGRERSIHRYWKSAEAGHCALLSNEPRHKLVHAEIFYA